MPLIAGATRTLKDQAVRARRAHSLRNGCSRRAALLPVPIDPNVPAAVPVPVAGRPAAIAFAVLGLGWGRFEAGFGAFVLGAGRGRFEAVEFFTLTAEDYFDAGY